MVAKQTQELNTRTVAEHNKEGDLWVIIDSKVYDLSKFAPLHPGGLNVLLEDDVRGKDVTELFYSLHRHEILERPQYARLQIGVIAGAQEQFKPLGPGSLSPVPYGEPQWLTDGYSSPYYKETHRKFQKVVRKLCDDVVIPEAKRCEASGKRYSDEFAKQMSDLNIFAMRIGPGKHLQGRKLLNGAIQPSEYDHFHDLILNQELARAGQRGFVDGFGNGLVIGLPTIFNYGSDKCKRDVVEPCLTGGKGFALAITEAFAGSDVAGVRTRAVKSEDGKEWIVTGTKKWITNGQFADFFATAVNTGKGLTMVLIPRGPGVNTKPIKTAYSPTAGTAYVTFDAVHVPIEYTLGEENGGLKVILSNFNHERWMITSGAVQLQRNVVDEVMRWANQRMVFGKRLIEQPVVRAKIAQMISRVESSQTWLEHITYQMDNMTYAQQSTKLGGPIGLLKQFVTRGGNQTAADATQIFGGRALTQTGLGSQIEHYHKTIQFDSVLGGTEDILADLGVKQAMKFMPKNARL